MITEKLYDLDSHLFSFDAAVLEVRPHGDRFAAILDRTAFFPEGGGQYGDRGTLADTQVLDTIEENGEILHILDREIPAGSAVHGEIDRADRMRKMQNHSGEHIVSGLLHSLYGLENVGFHLGRDDVTLDFKGELTRADLDRVEDLANRAVWENIEVLAEYPSPEKLANLSYRSKLELTENVRIVTISGYDVCACCAPHVARTGEIGLIKLADFARYKGGVRIHLRCGIDALADYREKYTHAAAISGALAVPQGEISDGVQRLLDEKAEIARKLSAAQIAYARVKAKIALPEGGNILLFDDMDVSAMREFVNLALEREGFAGIAGVFAGEDGSGYRFVMGSKAVDLRAASKAITGALGGRGGGSPGMIQGSLSASKAQITAYFEGGQCPK